MTQWDWHELFHLRREEHQPRRLFRCERGMPANNAPAHEWEAYHQRMLGGGA